MQSTNEPPVCFGDVNRFKPHPESVCMKKPCVFKNDCIDRIHGTTRRVFDANYRPPSGDGVEYRYNEIVAENKRAADVRRTDRLVLMFNSVGKRGQV